MGHVIGARAGALAVWCARSGCHGVRVVAPGAAAAAPTAVVRPRRSRWVPWVGPFCISPRSSGRTPLPDVLLPGPEPRPCHGRDPQLAFPGPGRDPESASLSQSPQPAWGAPGGRSEIPGPRFPGWVVPYRVTTPVVRFPCADDALSSCPGRATRPGGAALPAGAGPLQLRDQRQRDLPAAVPGVG